MLSLERACSAERRRSCTRRERAGALPLVAVNLSGTSLNEQSFVDYVLQSVAEPAIARALCFEITETTAVTSLANACYLMSELKGRKCRFALDDFGSGVSSTDMALGCQGDAA
jgi:EAL domain-containing protein (putative c-di-GMP-specific phosphodiesterase class I)